MLKMPAPSFMPGTRMELDCSKTKQQTRMVDTFMRDNIGRHAAQFVFIRRTQLAGCLHRTELISEWVDL